MIEEATAAMNIRSLELDTDISTTYRHEDRSPTPLHENDTQAAKVMAEQRNREGTW